MKILFVSSGNNPKGISPIIKNQGESLRRNGITLKFYTIKGTGITGYLKNTPKIRRVIKNYSPDIIHAHFSKSAYAATISALGINIPIVCSLMGSDVYASGISRKILKIFYHVFWDMVIVKSTKMKKICKFKKAEVVPNGVNLDRFSRMNKEKARQEVNFSSDKNNIIWVADPDRYEKNFTLAKKAVSLIEEYNVELNVINGVPHEMIPKYMYAADLLILTSYWEGSPNVVKEALACNLQVVSTHVGDVKELIGDIEGCYISKNYDEKVFAGKIIKAIEFKGDINSRKKINYLEEDKIAEKITKLYKNILREV